MFGSWWNGNLVQWEVDAKYLMKWQVSGMISWWNGKLMKWQVDKMSS